MQWQKKELIHGLNLKDTMPGFKINCQDGGAGKGAFYDCIVFWR